jgi:DNA replication protein DnaC
MSNPEPVTCNECGGSGWRTVGERTAIPCGCREGARRQQRVAAAHIPRRYIHCTFDAFADWKRPPLVNARNRAIEFADSWPIVADGRGLLLMGACGVGKTHLAVSVLHEIIRGSKPGRLLFSNFQELIQDIHASFSDEQAPSKSEILRPVIEADLLVLDELGSQKPTTFVQDVLYLIINSRYNEERPTIFTTNYVDDPRSPGEDTLEQRIGRPLRSRLHEMTERVVVEAEDYRRREKRTL